jgi:hypothetical protein
MFLITLFGIISIKIEIKTKPATVSSPIRTPNILSPTKGLAKTIQKQI